MAWVPALGGWLVTSYAAAVAVMRDPRAFTVDDPRFSTARVVGPSMLSLDGAAHARHRAPFFSAFHRGGAAARLGQFAETEAARLVAAIRLDGAAELRGTVTGPLAVAVVAEALGLGHLPPETILSAYARIVGGVTGLSGDQSAAAAGPPPDAAGAFAELAADLRAAIGPGHGSPGNGSPGNGASNGSPGTGGPGGGGPGNGGPPSTAGQRPPAGHRATAQDERVTADGRTVLADAARFGDLTTAEVVSDAAVVMFGGIDTTDGMIANAVLHLLSDPGQLELVRVDPRLVAAAIEESLRLEPAAALVDRYATRDVAIGEARVRAGDRVSVSLAAANRDPEVFRDPDRFDIFRANAGPPPGVRVRPAFLHRRGAGPGGNAGGGQRPAHPPPAAPGPGPPYRPARPNLPQAPHPPRHLGPLRPGAAAPTGSAVSAEATTPQATVSGSSVTVTGTAAPPHGSTSPCPIFRYRTGPRRRPP